MIATILNFVCSLQVIVPVNTGYWDVGLKLTMYVLLF